MLTIHWESDHLVLRLCAGDAHGSAVRGELDIELSLAVEDESLQPALRSLGFELDREGKSSARLGGTLDRPALR